LGVLWVFWRRGALKTVRDDGLRNLRRVAGGKERGSGEPPTGAGRALLGIDSARGNVMQNLSLADARASSLRSENRNGKEEVSRILGQMKNHCGGVEAELLDWINEKEGGARI